MITTVAEIGINYAYGEDRSSFVANAKKLIDAAKVAGFDYVKFQKRNPMLIPFSQRNKPKEVPWRSGITVTYLDYKIDVELKTEEYDEIDRYCSSIGMKWFASVFDEDSAEFMAKRTDIVKLPSCKIDDLSLLRFCRSRFKKVIMSTGMSDEAMVRAAYEAARPDVMMHTNSTYPSPTNELNLCYIRWIMDNYSCEVGYSGHEFGLVTTFAAAAMGATWIERHVTLDRTLWGSDQLASIEPIGMMKMIKGLKDIDAAMLGYGPRKLLESERFKMLSMRG